MPSHAVKLKALKASWIVPGWQYVSCRSIFLAWALPCFFICFSCNPELCGCVQLSVVDLQPLTLCLKSHINYFRWKTGYFIYEVLMSDYPLSETTNKVSLKPALSSFIEFTMSNWVLYLDCKFCHGFLHIWFSISEISRFGVRALWIL